MAYGTIHIKKSIQIPYFLGFTGLIVTWQIHHFGYLLLSYLLFQKPI